MNSANTMSARSPRLDVMLSSQFNAHAYWIPASVSASAVMKFQKVTQMASTDRNCTLILVKKSFLVHKFGKDLPSPRMYLDPVLDRSSTDEISVP